MSCLHIRPKIPTSGFMGETHVQIVPTRYDAQRGTAYFRAGTFGEIARRIYDQAVSLKVDHLDRLTFSGS